MNKIVTLLTISLSFCSILLSEITYLDSNSENIALSFELGEYEINRIEVEGTEYSEIISSSKIVTQTAGYPELPYYSVAVQIDPGLDYEIRIIDSQLNEINPQAPPKPSSGIIYRSNNELLNKNYDKFEYFADAKTNTFFPEENCTISTPYIIRDIRGTNLRISPFQYNYHTNELKIWERLKVELIPINDKNPTNRLFQKNSPIIPEMNSLYESVFINYDKGRDPLLFGESGSILIVYTERDEMVIEPYVSWKQKLGFHIYKSLVASGTNIKDIVLQQYIMNPDIFYVVIIGDWTDIESDLGTEQNRPMDPQLGCVAGEDTYPDLAVGRITAKTSIDIEIQINKIIQYEKNATVDDEFYGVATGIGSNLGSTNGDDGERDWEHLQNIWDNKLSPFSYTNYRSIYDPNASTDMIVNSLHSGTGLINYTGHGDITSWGTGGYDIYNVEYLENENAYPVIISAACNNGAFDYTLTDCLAEKFLKKNGGGAIFMLGSTIFQSWAPPMRGQDYMMDILSGGFNYDNFPEQNGITTSEQRSRIGSIVLNGLVLMITESDSQADWETMKTWTSFGDPSLQVRTKAPEEIFISNDIIIGNEQYSTYVYSGNFEPEVGAQVTISRGEVAYTDYTNEDGMVEIDHFFATGTVNLTITGQNLTTISRVIVLSDAGPYVTLQMVELFEEVGTEDGYIQPGDVLDVDILIQNVGNVNTLGNVTGTVSSNLENVTILNGSFTGQGLDFGEFLYVEDAFKLKLEPGTYTSNQVPIQIEFTTATESWNDEFIIDITLPELHLKSWSMETISGTDDVLNPGESAELTIELLNLGKGVSYEIVGTISELNNWVTSNNDLYIPTMLPDTEAFGDSPVQITLAENCPNGFITLNLSLIDMSGTIADTTITIPVGIYLESFESGELTWDHSALETEHFDSWHISETRNNTFGGNFSAKCGSISEESYLNKIFAGLESPEFDLQNTHVSFYHFMNTLVLNEESSWDGGYIELSVNGGEYFAVTPQGGYPFTISSLPNVAFLAGTPVFAGDIDWERVDLDLSAYSGIGRIRFVFGSSDLMNTGEGWYLDDIEFNYNVGVDEPEVPALVEAKLVNYPNPFNPTTTISFELNTEIRENIEVEIYNIKGQKIIVLPVNLSPGASLGKGSGNNYSITWNGTDKQKISVASGIYFATLKSGKNIVATRKMLLLK